MKKYTHLIAAGLLLGALSTLQTRAAVNTWSNGAGDLTWLDSSITDFTTISTNWTSPVYWNDGDDAIFGATGVGTVNLGSYVGASSLTFNADGYSIFGSGYTLTLSNAASVTVNNSATIQANIVGTNGLVVFGTTNLTLMGDGNLTVGNQFTGGTFVHGGNVIMAAPGVSSSGSSYAVDAINALDPGATVKYGVIYAGYDPSVDESATRVNVANAQMRVQSGYLYLTGGTLDLYGIGDSHEVPPPSGSGLIINTSPFNRAILRINNVTNGMVTEFDGQIADGGPDWTRSSDGPAYQMNFDEHSGNAATIILGGSNSWSGFTRWGNNSTIILTGAGTLGYPSPTNPAVRQVIMNNGKLDLNGTSQKTGVFWTKSDLDSPPCIITNSAVGTLSTLTLCFNDNVNTTAPTQSGANGGITCSLKDTPGTSGLLGITKMGAARQVIGGVTGVNSVKANPVNNYHGDTTVNNGILEIVNVEAASPNSSYRLNSPGVLQLDFPDTVTIGQLYLNGVRQPAGIYGSGQTSLITGSGSLQVLPPNVWTDGSANSLWDLASANWTNPTIWSQGSDAIFNATGAGAIGLNNNIIAENLTFNANTYVINGNGNTLTLIDAATITAAGGTSNTLQVSINGTNGVTFAGTGATILQGDPAYANGNNYTGQTYIHSGTVILDGTAGVNGNSSTAIGSIGSLDTGAVLKMFFPSATPGGPLVDLVAGQLPYNRPGATLIMTGGTLDLNGWRRNGPGGPMPCPQGSGLIVNSSPWLQSAMVIYGDGQNHTFSGQINDGGAPGPLSPAPFSDKPYQMGILDLHYGSGGYEWTLSGSNTYSGSTRLGNGSIKLSGSGTLGIPSTIPGWTGPLRIYQGNHLDLNGTSQTVGGMGSSGNGGNCYNTAIGTVSTLRGGPYGSDSFNCGWNIIDNPGTGGIMALTCYGTGTQQYSGTNTYSGDTVVLNGTNSFSVTTAVSPNSAFRIHTPTANGGVLALTYSGTATVRQLWVDGVQQPNGVYGSIGNSLGATGVAGIFPLSTGTLTVTGYAPVVLNTTQSGGNLNFTWSGVYKLQSKTNLVGGAWTDIPGFSPLSIPLDKTKKSVFYRLSTY